MILKKLHCICKIINRLYQKSLLEKASNKIDESKKTMENAIKLDPKVSDHEVKPNNIPPPPQLDKKEPEIPKVKEVEKEEPKLPDDISKKVEKYKEDGNNYYKQKKYLEAINCYSNGLELDDKNSALYRNRAACYLALNKYEETVKDCDKSLECKESDKNIIKSYHRRGLANKQLVLKYNII